MGGEFSSRMNGSFRGILQWADLDALWSRVKANPEGWYASTIGIEPEQQPMTPAALETFITEINALLRREHGHHYCGIVYADDTEHPAFIKIFDPHNLGSSCNTSGVRIPPRWILSRIQPSLIVDDAPLPSSRRHWWQKIFK